MFGLNSYGSLGYAPGPTLGDDELPSSYGYIDMGAPVIIGGSEPVLTASFTQPCLWPYAVTVQFDASAYPVTELQNIAGTLVINPALPWAHLSPPYL